MICQSCKFSSACKIPRASAANPGEIAVNCGSTAGRDRQARASSKGTRLDNSRCISCLLVCALLASRLDFAEPFYAAGVTNLHRVVPSTRAVISARGHSHRASLLNVLAPDWLQLAGVR